MISADDSAVTSEVKPAVTDPEAIQAAIRAGRWVPSSELLECKSRTGVTVGLIDSILSISHVLAERLKRDIKRSGDIRCVDQSIIDAMQDLGSDADLNFILRGCSYHALPEQEAVLYERVVLGRMKSRTPGQDARLKELDKMVQGMPTRALNDPDRAIDKFNTESFNFVLEMLRREGKL